MYDLKEKASEFGIQLDSDMIKKFDAYAELLINYNKKVNLTSIKTERAIKIKHFLDSLLAVKICELKGSLIDIGSGAGFPGVPLKIFKPEISLTTLDSNNKKINFLNKVSEKLLIEIRTIRGRAEEISRKNNENFREKFDICVSRAVAPLNILCELCLPFAAKNGVFLVYKGPAVENEILKSKEILKILGGYVSELKNFNLPDNAGKRVIIKINKIKPTPAEFPRSYSEILSKNL
jgi:16S rRNA (guanine527-N7)-methyltransferase